MRKRIIAMLLILFLAIVLPKGTKEYVMAGNTKGSVEVRLNDIGTMKKDVNFKLYQVGEGELKECFRDTNIIIGNLQYASDWENAAKVLAEHEDLATVPSHNGTTDEDGMVYFSSLDMGTYLLIQDGQSEYGVIDPVILVLSADAEKGKTDLVVKPKAEVPTEDAKPDDSVKPDDGAKPDTSAKPDTGDHANVGWYLALGIVALAVIGISVWHTIRTKKKGTLTLVLLFAMSLWMLKPTVAFAETPALDATQKMKIVTTDSVDKLEVEGGQYRLEQGTEVLEENFMLGDLAYGEYRLTETLAPNGYLAVSGEIEFQVSEQGVSLLTENENVKITRMEDGTYQITISNEIGRIARLPSTGGSGTGLHTLVGFVLIGISVIGFWILGRKKMLKAVSAVFVFATMMFAVGTTSQASDSYFHTADSEHGESYYLTSYEYEEIGYEFEDVGIEFQKSSDGRRYYVTNPEMVKELLEEISLMVEGKNTVPTLEKKIKRSDGQEVDKVNADIGERFTFVLTATMGKGARNVAVHDVIPEGLEKVEGSTSVSKYIDGEKTTLDIDCEQKNGEDTYALPDNLAEGTQVVITYEVVVVATNDMKDASEEISIVSKGWCTYGSNSSKSYESAVTVNVSKLVLSNGSENAGSFEKLSFELYERDASSGLKKIPMKKLVINSRSAGATVCYVKCNEGEGEVIEWSSSETLILLGLRQGKTYQLRFTNRPAGTENLKRTFEFEWSEGSALETLSFQNFSRTELLETGGIGTTVFYVAGSLLVLSSGALLLFRRRKALREQSR